MWGAYHRVLTLHARPWSLSFLPHPKVAKSEKSKESKESQKAKKAKKEAKKAKKEHKKRKREGSRDEDGLGESSSSEEEEGMIK